MMLEGHFFYVTLSYAAAAIVLAGLGLHSWWHWRQLRADYRRLFAREKRDA